MKTHTITITTLARPKDDGFITHEVMLPGWSRPVGTGSIEDARKVASGYSGSDPEDEIEVIEVNQVTAAEAKQARRAAALGLSESIRIPL